MNLKFFPKCTKKKFDYTILQSMINIRVLIFLWFPDKQVITSIFF